MVGALGCYLNNLEQVFEQFTFQFRRLISHRIVRFFSRITFSPQLTTLVSLCAVCIVMFMFVLALKAQIFVDCSVHHRGIGFALVKRLLQSDPRMHVCLACRNRVRAESARELLLVTYPAATVSIQLLDVASVKSVYRAAGEIRKKFVNGLNIC